MNRLWVRLALSFALVTVISVVVVGLVANNQVSTDFRRYYIQSQVQASGLLDRLTQYYASKGSWTGVDAILDQAGTAAPGMGGMNGMGQGMRRGGAGFVLADDKGRVVSGAAGSGVGAQLTEEDLNDAVPVTLRGTTVGYLGLGGQGGMGMGMGAAALTASGQLFLSQVNSSLVQAGLIAGALGLLLGIVIARGVSAPLGRVATAARALARGRLDQRVPVAPAVIASDEISDLARAFNEMAGSLQDAEQLRRNMVADIAHELRTPLSVVQGNLQAILDGVYPLRRDEIAAIHDETLVLGRLVGDLRELAQAEAGQLTLALGPVDVNTLVEGVVGRFRDAAAEKQIELTVAAPPSTGRPSAVGAAGPDETPMAYADPDRVQQVIYNLLANAIRHTPTGGRVSVSVSGLPANGPVRHDTGRLHHSTGGHALTDVVRIAVSDTGQGIAPEDLPRIFDRFWRSDRSRSRDLGGSGLGLTIARQLVEAQGGEIGADSTPGLGSVFWFTLPVAPLEQQAPAPTRVSAR